MPGKPQGGVLKRAKLRSPNTYKETTTDIPPPDAIHQLSPTPQTTNTLTTTRTTTQPKKHDPPNTTRRTPSTLIQPPANHKHPHHNTHNHTLQETQPTRHPTTRRIPSTLTQTPAQPQHTHHNTHSHTTPTNPRNTTHPNTTRRTHQPSPKHPKPPHPHHTTTQPHHSKKPNPPDIPPPEASINSHPTPANHKHPHHNTHNHTTHQPKDPNHNTPTTQETPHTHRPLPQTSGPASTIARVLIPLVCEQILPCPGRWCGGHCTPERRTAAGAPQSGRGTDVERRRASRVSASARSSGRDSVVRIIHAH